ncbi:MAG: sensor histidine kinase, partial [Deltaproteobacteria bacterium]|nr:sensor histidine kinase [Deltaproteobacteria bacterium]
SHGRRYHEYLFKRTEPCEICETFTVRKTGKSHHWEWVGPDGRDYDIYDYPFVDSDGSTMILEMGIDITAVKHAQKSLKVTNAALEQSRHELRRLVSELVMTEERERKRIAGVLHDDVAQSLAAVRMQLEALGGASSNQNEPTLMKVKGLLTDSLQRTRALMNDLGNPVLFELGLKAAIEALANRLMANNRVLIHCDIQGEFKNINPDVKTMLYQIVQELLNNVIKHSSAQNAHVRIEKEDGYFQVKVTDDGMGFDPHTLGVPTIEGGFGLYSIQERLTAVDGSLRIVSSPGAGTVVLATMPADLD